jgi:hypothetical protein
MREIKMTERNNNKLGWIAKIALATTVLFGASQSYAACAQSDLAGTWYFNGITGDSYEGYFWETDFCKIRFNSTGNVVKSSSQCKFRDSLGKATLDIIGGSLALNASCKISGKIKYDLGDGFSTNFVLDDARMDRGKTMITMVGRVAIDPAVVSFFTGVKK